DRTATAWSELLTASYGPRFLRAGYQVHGNRCGRASGTARPDADAIQKEFRTCFCFVKSELTTSRLSRGAGAVDVDMDRLANGVLQRGQIPLGGPLFQLGVSLRVGVDQQRVPAILHRYILDDLGVTPVQAFGDADEGGEELHAFAQAVGQGAI